MSPRPSGRVGADHKLEQHALAHLRQAESEVAWLRWFGMAAWALILLRGDLTVGAGGAWLVYAGGVAYAVWAHWRVGRVSSVRNAALLTSIGDPVLAALMCAMTGGLESLFYPFFYFTLLATAFRLGWREAVLVLGLNTALSIALYVFVPVPDARISDLSIAILYLVFSTFLGVMLERWAQQNLALARSRERAFRLARDRSRSLSRRLIHAQEEERRLVASDMHDRFGHHLFVLQQGLDALANDRSLPDDAKQRLKGLEGEAQACSNDVRLMMNELRPTVLDDFGFREAVREYVARMSDDVPLKLHLTIDDSVSPGGSDAEAMLFRIVQESLLNIRKHANAKRVDISFEKSSRPGEGALLTIHDDGDGFDPDRTEPGHLGLLTMSERAEALGGALEITSVPDRGTTVRVRLPVEQGA